MRANPDWGCGKRASRRGVSAGLSGLALGQPVLRILIDRATEYCGRVDKRDFQLFLAINDIDHTKTKVKSPQTNGICKRFHKTILQEFYQVAFRKKVFENIEALQVDLGDWLHHYNHERTH